MFRARKSYYWLVAKLSSDVELVRNFTGFGLYDREVVEQFRSTEEQYPYFRGLVSDFGYERAVIPYIQPARTRGKTKNDFFSLYDVAMLGVTNHSKVPLRLAAMAGFALSLLALVVAFVYLVMKLTMWQTFDLGLAPLVIGVYFLGSVQLFFIGILGEYIGAINTQVHKRPLVVERERINFDEPTRAGATPASRSGKRSGDGPALAVVGDRAGHEHELADPIPAIERPVAR
jgi:glycosyltransferase involved in cell wall biosynthesis